MTSIVVEVLSLCYGLIPSTTVPYCHHLPSSYHTVHDVLPSHLPFGLRLHSLWFTYTFATLHTPAYVGLFAFAHVCRIFHFRLPFTLPTLPSVAILLHVSHSYSSNSIFTHTQLFLHTHFAHLFSWKFCTTRTHILTVAPLLDL